MRFDPSGDTEYQLSQILNGRIEFGEHIQGGFVEVTLSSGENEVAHGLGFIPSGYILLSKEGAGDIWSVKLSEWSNEVLWLASSVGNLKVRLFVM